ncbi:MAG: glycosyltransferase family 39 protein, partial [Lachnospiraceae bacterium]|nr:glycosyltransferase family 39 protein [Lachnospiraceae bacterium]
MIATIKIGNKNIPLMGVILGVIFVTGSFLRLIALPMSPMGLHQDEAHCVYNAWSVMNYGVDSYGNYRPIYYTTGMSILYSYLQMPFIALFGINTWTIRLPQAILGSLSVPVMYGLGKEMRGPKTGIAFAALLAINPWHIQQSRFGLDCNLAVAMFLFAIWFLCRYLNGKRKSIWGASVFFGLTLYCYALTWVVVPVFLVLTVIFFRKRILWNRSLMGPVMLLFLFALPLLLFLAVNMGLIPAIQTPLFSTPVLADMRTGEMALSLSNLKRRFLWLVAMLWSQHDDMWWMSNATVGSYYYISAPFILLGIAYCVKVFWQNLFQKKELPLFFVVALWFGAGFLAGCNIDLAKFHKVNYIHTPIIIFGAIGVIWLCGILKNAACPSCGI